MAQEADDTIQDMKKHLLELPTLTTPIPGEIIYAYLAISEESLGTVLVREDRGIQRSVYFISKMLQVAEQH